MPSSLLSDVPSCASLYPSSSALSCRIWREGDVGCGGIWGRVNWGKVANMGEIIIFLFECTSSSAFSSSLSSVPYILSSAPSHMLSSGPSYVLPCAYCKGSGPVCTRDFGACFECGLAVRSAYTCWCGGEFKRFGAFWWRGVPVCWHLLA